MIDINTEVRKIVDYYNYKLPISEQKANEEVEKIIEEVIYNYNNKSFDFSNFNTLKIKQGNKIREVKQYMGWSTELFLNMYLKRILDRTFKINYPNRNAQIKLLFDSISAIQNTNEFTIVRFDFLDFFNSISSEYVYYKFLNNAKLDRSQKELLLYFIKDCPYCYAGINTSNIMAEIIASTFDKELEMELNKKGLIFYRRYIDDGILIFNKFITRDDCIKILNSCLDRVFKDKRLVVKNECKTKLNTSRDKFNYISKRDLDDKVANFFNYLGYNFSFVMEGKKVKIEYGITEEKILKYSKKIKKIIKDYLDDKNVELLRHRIRAFCCRTVYRRNKYKSNIWKVKGLISNYNELRYHLDSLDKETSNFLKNGVLNIFDEMKVKRPYFLRKYDENIKSVYCLYDNLYRNKTLLFEENERIGINLNTLQKMCKEIDIRYDDSRYYDFLLREYLIKIKVGH